VSARENDNRQRVVAVVGSPRPDGNTSVLVDIVLEELTRHGMACEKLLLRDYAILPCAGHDDCGARPLCPLGDDADTVLDKVYAADCLVLASPVYYEDVSALMKLFIDRNCHRYNHDRFLEPAAIGLVVVATETGLRETLDTLKRFVALSSGAAVKVFELSGLAEKAGDALGDGGLIEGARRLAHHLAGALSGETPGAEARAAQ
jgi:multimeric flavodoxin WrbA